MPSPRTSPAMRPTSPLSPRQAAHFDSLQPPSPQRPMHSRTGSNQRRPPANSLKLPSLPRFHPANFPSAHSSVQNTPDGTTSPQPPVSPRAHQRMYSDAQKQLYFNQREMLSAAVRSPNSADKPISPRLHPLGSPGPVTPLELEGDEGYLLAGARSSVANTSAAPEELIEKLIREETRRHRSGNPSASASCTGR
ncbi:Hypothetical predicted protein [Lecanosticta acicola]|uniref:Uncharacterized protein n=1 Tax=Lecanosticta acicola TaxID=111012 RepID=A0AAI8Z3Z7_9PEZI|nr:Hypothetical predicted protein [Lecanosticta acicola]